MADLIDRDALLKDMGLTDAVKYGNKDSEQKYRSYSTWMSYEIADSIREAPAVNRWIPCSEKRPDFFGYYLTYNAVTGSILIMSFSPEYNTFGIYDCEVSHWMPLPEPPEKE